MIDTTDGSAATLELSQPMRALQHANEIRGGMAALKRRIKSGGLHLDAVLIGAADLDAGEIAALESMTVMAFLTSGHRVGRARARRTLSRVQPPIGETRRVGMLTTRQRHLLASACRLGLPTTCGRPPL